MAKLSFIMLTAIAAAASPSDPLHGYARESPSTQQEVEELRQALAARKPDVPLSHSSATGSQISQVPTAPAAGPAAAKATPSGHASPEDLAKLSEMMSTGQTGEQDQANDMFAEQKHAQSVAAAQTKISQAAASAEMAHTAASDAHATAQEMSIVAAEARDAANKAVAAMNEAKKFYDGKLAIETKATQDANAKEKVEKKAEVAFKTAEMKAKQLKLADAQADKASQYSKDTKEAKDEELFQMKRTHAEHLEALSTAEGDAAEKASLLDLATKAWEALRDAHAKAEKEDEELQEALGVAQSENAKFAAEEKEATNNADLTREDFERKNALAIQLDEAATQAEAKAKAAARESENLAAAAKAAADGAKAQ